MIDIEYIKERKEFLVDSFHSGRVAEQEKEQAFYDDTFAVDVIQSPQYLSRTGTAAWLIDGPTAHIITQNPQVFVNPIKNTDTGRESANKVNSLLNHWVSRTLKQSPQPFREFVKKLLLRGEAWIHPIYDENWAGGDKIPILFLIPDPLNIFASPVEEYGIPEEVVVVYERSPWLIKMKYPEWSNPKNKGEKGKAETVEWFEYWRKDYRYFSADNEPVLKGGVQENILKTVPFIHAYSGFGDSSPDGKPETLALGRLRKVKDLLIQECAINSDIDSTIHKFAKPRIDLIAPEGAEGVEDGIKETYDMGAGSMNILPFGTVLKEGERILPTQEAFQHFYNIRQRIAAEAPPIMSGLASGSSGRQEDIVGTHFIRRFDSIVEATEIAFAQALDMGKDFLKIVPGFLPITQFVEVEGKGKKIFEGDLDSVTDCRIELKAADPIEDDRKLMAGRALKQENLIDWETFLVEYTGYTPERAAEIMEQTIADTVVMSNPILFQALAEKALENLGMHEQLERLREQTKQQEKMSKGLEKPTKGGEQGGEPRQFNAQSPEAREMVDMMLSQKGARRAPQ